MPLIDVHSSMGNDVHADGRLLKRRKLSTATTSLQSRLDDHSRIFAPYRTIGLVSPTDIPFTSQPLGKTTFQITTSIGRSLQTYDLRRGLNLVFVTRPQVPGYITASAAWRSKILAAWIVDDSCGVWIYSRGKKETELEYPPELSVPVRAFCIFGPWIVGVSDTQLIVWKAMTLELYTVLTGASPVHFAACVAKPPALVNKILAGRRDGSVEIWNVSSGKLVYTIFPPSTSYGAVTAIEPTPALGLVAVAYENGMLLIHDIYADRIVLHLGQSSGAPVTSISFRTDGHGAGEDGTKAGVMATASTSSGDISVWDLNDGGRKAGILRSAHGHPTPTVPGGTSKVEFLPGQAVLVSSGRDNSLKTWIFDQVPFKTVPRPLHSRCGHSAPIKAMIFLPTASDGSEDTGKWLMTASTDQSLWAWSLRRDGQSAEISQGAIQKKAKKQGLLATDQPGTVSDLKCPPITSIACSLNRDGGIGAIPGKHSIWQNAKGKQSAELSATTGWESVVTGHENDKNARTWLWGRKRAGRWTLPTGDTGNVSSVGISPCGTFALVASALGSIDMFNLQSGLHRQSFPGKLTPMQAKQWRWNASAYGLMEETAGARKFYRGQGKHRSSVIGVAVDSLNHTVISAESDGKINFWDFASGLLRHQIDWSASTSFIAMHYLRNSELLGVSCSDGCIRIIDSGTSKLIRELWPSRPTVPELVDKPMTAFTFSSDGRWIAASVDTLVLLWDLPTGHVVDAFTLGAECSSLAFSPTGEFLAVSTRSSVGVDILTNRSVFANINTHRIDHAELCAVLRTRASKSLLNRGNEDLIAGNAVEETQNSIKEGTKETDQDYPDVEIISSQLLSLSMAPRSRWQNLLNLDTIRQRNKPVEPPKKPEKAPFFLPALQDRTKERDIVRAEAPGDGSAVRSSQSRLLNHGLESNRGAFGTLLSTAKRTEDYNAVIEYFQSLAPATADLEIRSLSLDGQEALTFVNALISIMRQRRAYELGQTWMAVFLRIHGDVVAEQPALRLAVGRWRELLDEERQRVQHTSGYVGGMVAWLRAARV